MKRVFYIFFLFFVGITVSIASPLAIELKAFAIEEIPGAEPKLTEVEEVKPGQLIEYRAVFTNVSKGVLNGVTPEVPVPVGMSVVLESIDPEFYTVSTDGINFIRVPLDEATGKPLGVERIRSVRWNPVKLDAGATLTASLRAKVNE